MLMEIHTIAGREIAPNTGANATKFFTLATKSWKLVRLLERFIITLPRDIENLKNLQR